MSGARIGLHDALLERFRPWACHLRHSKDPKASSPALEALRRCAAAAAKQRWQKMCQRIRAARRALPGFRRQGIGVCNLLTIREDSYVNRALTDDEDRRNRWH